VPEIVQGNVDRTNVIYGALDPSVRNVYSTHGQLDPWRAMGAQEDINEFSPTVILPREFITKCKNGLNMLAWIE
jgi:hypothetical protein